MTSPTPYDQLPTEEKEAYLEAQFDDERIQALTTELIDKRSLVEIADGRQFAIVSLNPGDSSLDIARSIESKHFAGVFDRTLADVYEEYQRLDPWSVHLVTIDLESKMPAGSVRLVANSVEKGLKSVDDVVVDDFSNPWLEEIKSTYFSEEENYDPEAAKERLLKAAGLEDFDPDDAYDVATRSVYPGYSSKAAFDGVSMAMLHSVFWKSITDGKRFLVTIQDVAPLEEIQAFGGPFDTFPGLQPHPYGGPFDTLPAFANIERGVERIQGFAPEVVPFFLEGEGLKDKFALLKETEPVEQAI